MKQLIITICFISIVGIIFALPLTINSFISDSPLYPEDKQEIINNPFTNEDNADFDYINSKINKDRVKYDGPVEHLFTHCLIAYPNLAFASDNIMAKDYARDCITSVQFESILNELYKNNYVLVDINNIYKNDNGKISKNEIYLPKGKKPLVLSFDDVVYDHRKMKNGMVDKLVVNANGKVVSETVENWKNGSGKVVQSDRSEFVSILDNFVEKHPDFSIDGAKGTICLTGFDGILGYRTASKNIFNRQEEIRDAKKVATKLKENGWNFACHSFGHYHMKQISDEKFAEEIKLWQEEVEPLIGKTSVYVYPYGEWELNDENLNYSSKHQMLLDAGFELFCGVGVQNFFGYLPFSKTENKTLFMDRTPLDGFTLENNHDGLERLFDSDLIKNKIV